MPEVERWEIELARSDLFNKEQRAEVTADLKALRLEMAAGLQSMRKDAATNWPLLGTVATIAVAIIGFIVASMIQPLSGKIDVLTDGVKSNSAEIQALRDSSTRSSAADAASSIDRANLNNKTIENTKAIAEFSQKLASISTDFISRTTEVETQNDATAQASALEFAGMTRQINALTASVSLLGGKLVEPTNDPYVFPNMSNREAHKENN